MFDAPGGPGIDIPALPALHCGLHVGDDLHAVLEREVPVPGDDRVRPVGTPEYPLDRGDPVAGPDTVEQPSAGDDPADDAAVRRGPVIGGMPHTREYQIGPGGVVAAAPKDDVAPLVAARFPCRPNARLKRPEGGGVAVLPVQPELLSKSGRKNPGDQCRIRHLDDHIAGRGDKPDLLRLSLLLEHRPDDGDAEPGIPVGEEVGKPGILRNLNTFSVQKNLHYPHLRGHPPPSPSVRPR